MSDPLIQLSGYISTTNLDVNSNKSMGKGTNRGIYGAVTWPIIPTDWERQQDLDL